jgi:VanZ family protein
MVAMALFRQVLLLRCEGSIVHSAESNTMRSLIVIPQQSLSLLWRVLLWLAFVVNLALIFNFGLIKVPTASLNFFWFVRGDHFLHALAFCSLGLTTFALFNIGKLTFAFLVCIGAGLELLQAFTPPRQPSLSDVAADVVGIVIAAVLLIVFRFVVSTAMPLVAAPTASKA